MILKDFNKIENNKKVFLILKFKRLQKVCGILKSFQKSFRFYLSGSNGNIFYSGVPNVWENFPAYILYLELHVY